MPPADRSRYHLPLIFALVSLALLFAITLAGARMFAPPLRALTSLLAQHLVVIAAFVWVATVARAGLVRAAALGLLAAYVLTVEAHTLSMMLFSVPADAVAHLLAYGSDPSSVLAQAHVSADDLEEGIAVVVGQVAALALLYRYLPRIPVPLGPRVLAAASLACIGVVIVEQAASRGSDDYVRRTSVLPGYYRLFTASPDEYTFAMPHPASEEQLDTAVARVRGAANPKNVVFIVLESVRYDVIDEDITPNLDALKRESLFFTKAYADATYTARVWNVLLLNRPAYMVFRDLEAFEAGTVGPAEGAFPARILKRAGYQIMVSMPTEFDWFGFQRRFMGTKGLVDRFFSSYPGHNRARHIADERATDEVVSWLSDPQLKDPFFLLMQLDSTHYRYFFYEDEAVVRPFAEAVSPKEATTQESLDLLFNRYKNAVHYVDHNIGRVVDALRASGRYDDTAIVVISDHGEGFDLGAVAHVQVNAATKHVPWLMRLPGVPGQRVDALTSHRDVFPTLFEYLQIEGLSRDVLLGRPAWSPPASRHSVLTLQGAMKQATLTFPLFTVMFDIGWPSSDELTFMPVGIVDVDGRPVSRWRDLLGTLPWKTELQGNLRWARAAVPPSLRPNGA